MRKLALCDDILMHVEKPARYIGGEVNSVMKDKKQVSALAPAGIHRESRHGQAVNVPVDGAGGHLEMRRQFFRCHRTLVH